MLARRRPRSRTSRPGPRSLRLSIARLTEAVANPPTIDRRRALARTERMDAMTMIVSSAEHLARPGERRRGGFNDWTIAGRNLHRTAPRLARIVDVIAPPKITAALHAARVVAGLALLAPTSPRTRTAADATILASTVLLHPRSLYGTDGTDQVAFLVTANTTLARLGRHPALVDTALWAIALQATISYAASGWVKVTSETWRSGRALTGVARTQTYGDAAAFKVLSYSPRATQVVAVGVLGMECLFPLIYLRGGRWAHPWLSATLVFHLANARIMGLGRFVWAFGSMHPAVLYTADRRNRHVRDDTLPKLTAAMGAVALVAGAIDQARRRKRVTAVHPGEQRLRTRLGNELVYSIRGHDDGEGPIVVLEAGLLASPRLWAATAVPVARRYPVVSYARAGYGASTYQGTTDFTLDQSADDLVDLIAAVSGGGTRPVVLAGHSLGGWIALKAAARAPHLVAALGLVDSSHPAELQRSSRQAAGEKSVTLGLQMVHPSLAAGLGWLLVALEYRLPDGEHERYDDEYRDPGLWRAGLREWRSVQKEFWEFDGQLPALRCPVLVLTAEQTHKLDPTQVELHEELATLGTEAEQEMVAGVDHMGIVTNPEAAAKVAEHLVALADRLAGREAAILHKEAEHAG
jgi:pimeloyl-ACP methyl ester carboxylesterase